MVPGLCLYPDGGSRVDRRWKLVRNLFIVWILTGVWHGASWNFILWGFFYGVLITFEKLTGVPKKFKSRIGGDLYRIFTILCVMLGWVLFRADGLNAGLKYLVALTGITSGKLMDMTFVEYVNEYRLFLIAGILFSLPFVQRLWKRAADHKSDVMAIVNTAVCMLLLIISVSYIVLESYNPFIYFNF